MEKSDEIDLNEKRKELVEILECLEQKYLCFQVFLIISLSLFLKGLRMIVFRILCFSYALVYTWLF